LPASRALLQCAQGCDQALQECLTRFGVSVEHDVFRELVPAIASVRAAADLLDDRTPRRELVLRLARDSCGRAATECRRHGFDESLLRCAAAFGRTVGEIELLLVTRPEKSKQD
jgi:hypothetical protein